MRNTKTWLVVLLCALMLVNTLGVSAMAANNESPLVLYAPPAARVGSPVQVQIAATQDQAVADGKLVVTYDAAKLTYNGADLGAAWSDEQLTLSVNPTEGKVILAFANAEAAKAGNLFVLRFTAAETGSARVAIDAGSYLTGVETLLNQELSISISPAVLAEGWSGYTTWRLTADGVLTVSPTEERFEGKCNMRNYWKENGTLTLPWGEYADQITTVVIEEGVNAVGQMAFYELPNLKTVVLPDSIEEVRNYAFKNDTALTDINLSVVETVREGAFYGCTALEVVDLPADAVVEDWAFTRVPGYNVP